MQGAEGEVLDGLDDAGWRDVLIVNTEVSTRQLYAGQALFHEVCTKLYARGFVLAATPKVSDFSDYRTGLGWRGNGFPAHGDALFFRDHKHLVSNATWPILSLYKLAFFVLCAGNVAYALKCAAEARKMGEVSNPPEYIKLVRRISELHASEDEIMPPGFSHIWTAERSLAHFGPDRATEPLMFAGADWKARGSPRRSWVRISTSRRKNDPAPRRAAVKEACSQIRLSRRTASGSRGALVPMAAAV